MTEIDLTDKTVLIGSPSSTLDLVAGSELRTAACGHDVYVAPSGQEILKEPDAVLMCVICVMTNSAVVDRVRKDGLSVTAQQRQEVNEALGVAETDQIFAVLGIKQREVSDD